MTNGERDERAEFPAVVEGLERLASGLDGERYPGQAWLAGVVHSRRRWKWGMAAGLVGFAAGVCVVAGLWWIWRGAPVGPAPREVVKQQDPVVAPTILVFEDRGSYSVVDLSGEVPVVSYATRNSSRFEFITPVFVAPPKPAALPTTRDSAL